MKYKGRRIGDDNYVNESYIEVNPICAEAGMNTG